MLNCKSDEIIPKNLATVLLSVEQNLVAQSVQNPPAIRETQVRSVGGEDPLEKETATHSSILAWRTPRTDEPGGLQSMGSQRLGHVLATEQQQQIACFIQTRPNPQHIPIL